MQFTLTTDYAIRTVFYLAKEKQIRNAETLAVNLGIPLSYVPKVTSLLKKAGIIDAMEGVQGGYYLIKDPLKIALWDIISVTENTVQINRCLEKDHFCSRYAVETCPVRKVYKNIQEEFEDRFKNISISDMVHCLKKVVGKKNFVFAGKIMMIICGWTLSYLEHMFTEYRSSLLLCTTPPMHKKNWSF